MNKLDLNNNNMKSQLRIIKETSELILIYVNENKTINRRWYEALNCYDSTHFECDIEFIKEKTKVAHGDFSDLKLSLLRNYSNELIFNKRLPKL